MKDCNGKELEVGQVIISLSGWFDGKQTVTGFTEGDGDGVYDAVSVTGGGTAAAPDWTKIIKESWCKDSNGVVIKVGDVVDHCMDAFGKGMIVTGLDHKNRSILVDRRSTWKLTADYLTVVEEINKEGLDMTKKHERYGFSVRNESKIDVQMVEVDPKHPYAILSVDNEDNVSFIIHPTLWRKADVLNTPFLSVLGAHPNGNLYMNIDKGEEVKKTQEFLSELIAKPWPNKERCNVTVTVYSE